MRAGTYTEALTLADAVFPRVQTDSRVAALARDIALMVGFAGFVALCAQIAVRLPWTTVPITGQTFAVLVAGGAPGGADVTGNWDMHFILPWDGTHALVWDISSGGYIVGFILAAGLVGYLAERQWDRKPWVHMGMFLGNAHLYIPGILWLPHLLCEGWG